MLRSALVVCALAAFWGNQVEGFELHHVKIGFIPKSDYAAFKKLAAQINVNVKAVAFGMRLVVQRTIGNEGSKFYIPKGFRLYAALVNTPNGRCVVEIASKKTGVVDHKHSESMCSPSGGVVIYLKYIRKVKDIIGDMIQYIKKAIRNI